jgi:hypothetical protein
VHPQVLTSRALAISFSCDALRGTTGAFGDTIFTHTRGLSRVSQVILTAVGYLLLLLSGLAVCLFCWLSYSCLRRAARSQEPPAEDKFLEDRAHDISGPVGAGS